MTFLYILGIIFVTFGMSFVLINIRQVLTGKEFRGTCATNNPMLKNQIGECTVCGKGPDEECKNPEKGNKKMSEDWRTMGSVNPPAPAN